MASARLLLFVFSAFEIYTCAFGLLLVTEAGAFWDLIAIIFIVGAGITFLFGAVYMFFYIRASTLGLCQIVIWVMLRVLQYVCELPFHIFVALTGLPDDHPWVFLALIILVDIFSIVNTVLWGYEMSFWVPRARAPVSTAAALEPPHPDGVHITKLVEIPDYDCMLCLEPHVKDKVAVVFDHCGHKYHRECVIRDIDVKIKDGTFRGILECPLCRDRVQVKIESITM